MIHAFPIHQRIRYPGLRAALRHQHVLAIAGSLTSAFTTQTMLLVTGVLGARLLGPENRGYLALVVFVAGIVGTVVAMGVASAVTYYISLPTADNRSVVTSTFRLYLIQMALVATVQITLLLTIFRHYPAEFQAALLLTLPQASASALQAYSLAFLQGGRDFRKYNVLRLAPLFSYMLLLVAVWRLGIASLLTVTLVWAIGSVAGSLATFTALTHHGSHALTASTGLAPVSERDLVRFGARSFLGTSSPVETFRIDQAIVALLLNPVALGIYAAALGFTNLPRFIGQSVGVVAFPSLAAAPSSVGARRAILRYAALTFVLSLLVVIPLLILTPWLVTFLLGSQFAAAAPIVRILLIGSLLFSLRRVLSDSLRGLGYPQDGTIAEVMVWIVLVPALPLLASRYELTGVAIAMVIAAVVGTAWPCYRVWELPRREPTTWKEAAS